MADTPAPMADAPDPFAPTVAPVAEDPPRDSNMELAEDLAKKLSSREHAKSVMYELLNATTREQNAIAAAASAVSQLSGLAGLTAAKRERAIMGAYRDALAAAEHADKQDASFDFHMGYLAARRQV